MIEQTKQNEQTKRYGVTKTVTEYHYFSIEATSLNEAWDKARELYCDEGCANDTYVEVKNVEEEAE